MSLVCEETPPRYMWTSPCQSTASVLFPCKSLFASALPNGFSLSLPL